MPLTGAAAVRLYDDHVDAVHALIARRVGIEASPQVTAEAFEHALASWERYDPNDGTERLFLFGAAVAVLRDHPDLEYRHLSNLRGPSPITPPIESDPLVSNRGGPTPRVVAHAANRDLLNDADEDDETTGVAGSRDEDAVDELEPDETTATMRAVAELPADDRDILLLSLWESCPQSSIAEALGTSVGSVRSALGRIRRELRVASADAPRQRRKLR